MAKTSVPPLVFLVMSYDSDGFHPSGPRLPWFSDLRTVGTLF